MASTRRSAYGLLPLGGGILLALAASVVYSSVPAAARAPARPAGKQAAPKPVMPAAAQAFLRKNCVACHTGASAAGKLDLTKPFRPDDAANFNAWVKVID